MEDTSYWSRLPLASLICVVFDVIYFKAVICKFMLGCFV